MTLIDFLELLKRRAALVILLPILCAGATAVYAWCVMPDTYTAKTEVYVLVGNNTANPTSSDLNASQMVTNDVIALVTSDRVKSNTASVLGLSNLNAYGISATSGSSTRLINISVTSTDPQEAAVLANLLVGMTSKVAKETIGIENINVVQVATPPTYSSGPNRLKYVGIAFLGGLCVAVAIAVFMNLSNKKICNEKEIESLLGISVIGRIPRF